MLSAIKLDQNRVFHSDPYAHLGDMESEIAELRTMTRVTKLRQQIECRQEGAWMMVRDVPDDRSKGGTRKVTTYGRSTRSVTRSFTSDVDLGNFISNNGPAASHEAEHNKRNRAEAIVEFPDDYTTSSSSKPASAVEITEVIEDEPETNELNTKYATIKTSPTKKTSVVTLGQGNVVLIDPQDSNFKVTGISKERDDDVCPQKPVDKGDKKVKKVGFCKTEVHFAPDSGKVNIVETDEKPPSSQVLRRKKKPRKEGPPKSSMPKLYFGDSEKGRFVNEKNPISKEDLPVNRVSEHVFPVIREPSPLLSTSIANQARSELRDPWSRVPSPKNEDVLGSFSHYGELKKNHSQEKTTSGSLKTSETSVPLKNDALKPLLRDSKNSWAKGSKGPNKSHYLGNVSPKLSKLISNNIQHEFQQKQMQILRKSRDPDVTGKPDSRDASPKQVPVPDSSSTCIISDENVPVAVNIHVTSEESTLKVKPMKIVAQVQVTVQDKKGKLAPEPRTKRIISEPVYANNDAPKSVTRTINITQEEDKSPKPRSSQTRIVAEEIKERKRTKSLTKPTQQPEKLVRKSVPTPRPREIPKREVAVVKPMKPYTKNTITRVNEPCKRSKNVTPEVHHDTLVSSRSSKLSRSTIDKNETARTKKIKEPLRSFEKVSNGWVGHCIVPMKPTKTSSKVSITTSSATNSTPASISSKIQEVKGDKDSTEAKNSVSVRIENNFQTRSSLTTSNKQFSLSKEHLKSAKLVKELYKGSEISKPDVPRPRLRAGPRAGDDKFSPKQKSIVSRRRLVYEEGLRHSRRDSEQSDDSVIRADEEVRAYMFNSKSKVWNRYWWRNFTLGGSVNYWHKTTICLIQL